MSIFKHQDNRILFRYLLIPHIIFSILLLLIVNESMGYITDFIYNLDIISYLISFAFNGIFRIILIVIAIGTYLFFFTKGLKKLNEKFNFSNQPIKMSSVLLALFLTLIAIVSINSLLGKSAVVFLLPIIINMIFIKKISGNQITFSWQEIKDNFFYYMDFSIKFLIVNTGIFLIFAAFSYTMLCAFLFDFYFLSIQLFIFLWLTITLYIISVLFTYVIKNPNSKY